MGLTENPKSCPCIPVGLYPWMILIAICFLTFGSYWVYDTPGAIQTPLTNYFAESGMTYTNSDNSLLYSVYSWPNVILAFFGGYIIDRFLGVRLGSLLFCSLVLLGQVIFSMGIQFSVYYVCVIGRFVYGLGGESLTVSQSTFTARWFDGKLLALAFGIVVSFSRIGSSVNFIVTPTLAKSSDPAEPHVPLAVWFGTLMCVVSLISCITAGLMDYIGRDRVHVAEKNPDDEKPSLTHVRFFPLPAWNLMLITMIFYIAVLVFYQVASDIMQNTGVHKYSATTASYFLAIPNIVSIFASPTFGYIIDKFGRALWFVFFASLALVIGHLGFLGNALMWWGTTWQIYPPILMVWMGFAYSAGAAAVWPIMANIIHEKLLATAYGSMTSLQNLGLAVFPLLISGMQDYVKNHSDSGDSSPSPLYYALPIIVFILCALTSAVLTFLNIFLDKKFTQGRLNASRDQRNLLPPLADPVNGPRKAHEKAVEEGGEHDKLVNDKSYTAEWNKDYDTIGAGEDAVPIELEPKKDTAAIRRNYLARLGIAPVAGH